MRWLRLLVLCWALGNAGYANASEPLPIRIGLTPVFLDDQTAFIQSWQHFIESKLHRPVQFIQGSSYSDIMLMLRNGKLDFAWLCGYPYVTNKKNFRLLAVPLYQGKPTYRSYLIVPATDKVTRAISDLKGKVFAFSDPNSNSGYLVAANEVHKLNAEPNTFFGKTFFTWSHRKVVEAVSIGLAQGGSVDGYIWDTLAIQHPELTSQTRIAAQSIEYGFPPFVAGKLVGKKDFDALQKVLTSMPDDEAGRTLLRLLNLDGFIVGAPHLFDDIAQMARSISH